MLNFKKLFFLASVTVLSSLATRAATVTVTVGAPSGADTFSPATVNINTGDTVKWVWAGLSHNTTSDTGDTTTWASATQSTGGTPFSFSFPNAGSFPYECTIHAFAGMFGTVNVAASAQPNQPPTVAITNPPASSVLSAPANFTIGATAADSDGTVASVQFFVDGTPAATVTTPPYVTTVTGEAAGSHTITAIATDNLGATTTNSIALSVVTPTPITIGQVQTSSATNFQFSYSATPGLFYVVTRASTLGSWTPLSTNKAQTASVIFTDTNTPPNAGFYRVGQMPNP